MSNEAPSGEHKIETPSADIKMPPLVLTASEEIVFHCAVADFIAFQEARLAVLEKHQCHGHSRGTIASTIAAMRSFIRKIEALRCCEVVVAYAPPEAEPPQ